MADPKNHNVIFENLVENERDFIGIVAYSLYKQQKVEWIRNFNKSNGRPPDEKELKSGFLDFASMESQKNSYKDSAISLVEEFNWQALENERDEIEKNIKEDAIVKAVTPTATQKITGYLLSSLVSSVVTLAIAILVWALAKGGASGLLAEAEDNLLNQQESSQEQNQASP